MFFSWCTSIPTHSSWAAGSNISLSAVWARHRAWHRAGDRQKASVMEGWVRSLPSQKQLAPTHPRSHLAEQRSSVPDTIRAVSRKFPAGIRRSSDATNMCPAPYPAAADRPFPPSTASTVAASRCSSQKHTAYLNTPEGRAVSALASVKSIGSARSNTTPSAVLSASGWKTYSYWNPRLSEVSNSQEYSSFHLVSSGATEPAVPAGKVTLYLLCGLNPMEYGE
mmetsp:Transcript_17386/g.44164  ORF Transcript_17386/g.44164 Transcript_17386/m.44164 type:complete len:223 (+) Transcript_17386:1500-2168(+)